MDVPSRYFRDAKPAFLQLIDPRGLRVLDLGCGGGHNGAMLKKAGAREVVGVELDAGAAAEARKRLDRVCECDLAHLDPIELGDEPFDAILASDVLEHLLDAEERARPGRLAPAPGRGRGPLAAQRLQRLRLRAAAAQDVAAQGIGDLRPHPRALVRQARHGHGCWRAPACTVLRVEPYFTRYRAIRAASLVLSLYVFRDYWARQFLLLAVKPDRTAGRDDDRTRPTEPGQPRGHRRRTLSCWRARTSS